MGSVNPTLVSRVQSQRQLTAWKLKSCRHGTRILTMVLARYSKITAQNLLPFCQGSKSCRSLPRKRLLRIYLPIIPWSWSVVSVFKHDKQPRPSCSTINIVIHINRNSGYTSADVPHVDANAYVHRTATTLELLWRPKWEAPESWSEKGYRARQPIKYTFVALVSRILR